MDSWIMKKRLLLCSILSLIFAPDLLAQDIKANEWGAITNNIQMSIRIKTNGDIIKTNQPTSFFLCIKNVSTNETLRIHEWASEMTDAGDLFHIIAPSGRDVSPKPAIAPHGSGRFVPIGPCQTHVREFDANYVCKFNELGTYTIVAKEDLGDASHPCWVISNKLLVSVVAGEWKEKTTNALPAGL